MKIELLNVFTFLAAVQCLFLCFAHIWQIRRARNNLFSGLLFLAGGYLFLYISLYVSGYVEENIFLFQTEVPLLYFFGPATWRVFRLHIEEKEFEVRKDWWHFAPPILCVFVLLPSFLEDPVIKLARLTTQFDLRVINFPKVVQGLSALSLLSYGYLLFRKFWPLLRWRSVKVEHTARIAMVVVILILVMLGSLLLSTLLRSPVYLGAGSSIAGFGFVFISLVAQANPENFIVFKETLIREVARYSHLRALDIETITANLRKAMTEDRLYKEEDLSLQSLAAKVNLSIHQLSEYLNKIEEKSFFHFINQFRVEHAQRLIREDGERSILTIAYEVGFNSKSSFNTAFRKITGVTPRIFREQCRIEAS